MAVFLANVGVNAGHAARSPLFADRTFALLPIPERHSWRRPMLRFKDLDRPLHIHAPRSWRDRAIHLDPDLLAAQPAPTYGDNCRHAGRAFSLRRARPGDLIAFLARLHGARPGFYLVGRLEIADVLEDVTRDPGTGWWDGNAHVRRARALGHWDSFWVFRGSVNSGMFERAVPFARLETETLFGRDNVRWPVHRTELQTIGSYTRAVRRIEGDGEAWLRTICRS